ncbi:hypothetical protein SETIT_5G292900v2 [Setaria italica]|uniref:Uncharacterized protein n=1 Tax=Setaria italica TaxID=4555 RepID=A0A368RA27_SETIT|nr:hypothetical protein SETIT_5G292900v2 [Setaria italica]
MAVRTLWMIIMVMVVFHFGLAGEPVSHCAYLLTYLKPDPKLYLDYSEFNLELCLYSVFGTATAFIWLYHPNICVALQYKSTSYILGFLRGVEVYQWIVPKFAAWLRKVEGAEEATGPERYDE